MEQLQGILDAGFAAACVSTVFCTSCGSIVCDACCGEDHVTLHHEGEGDLVTVGLIRNGVPSVSARAVRIRSLGYDWRGIQRITFQGADWVPLVRQPNPDERSKNHCNNCQDRTKKDYCCAACKRTRVTRGGGRDVIQALVHTDFAHAHVRDRLCLMCMRAFSSVHCPDHAAHAHAEGAVGVGAVLEMHHGDGWLLVREDAIPGQAFEGIRRVDMNGSQMVPVQRRMLAVPDGPNQCPAAGCQESVQQPGETCSIRCRPMV